ncbi:Alpha-tubulin N-acetyltransferase [Portunus trituberculatus]|uniref:Alpha-tubulin N-acetyltransferase n=1 Tax=Portunus trituberculatus TaxID=210409 RepID=A0A5B7HK00_PORTR|nr:Alpha-tubulin N-acetyltransferase [Portunus trituberculatus]
MAQQPGTTATSYIIKGHILTFQCDPFITCCFTILQSFNSFFSLLLFLVFLYFSDAYLFVLFRVEYQQLYEIINAIGEASSFAQGLNNVITTSEKLQNSDHLLYLMKEDDDSIGVTLVVGMLKVGRKKLFLLDPNQRTKEAGPLCVLDFYIHESRQRRGYGRRLFDYMLRVSHQGRV